MHGCYKHTTPTLTQQRSLPAFHSDETQKLIVYTGKLECLFS